MNKKILAVALLPLMLTACNNLGNQKVELEKTIDSKMYFGPNTDGDVNTETALSLPSTFFNVKEDVPYVKIEDFFNNVFNQVLLSSTKQPIYTYENGVITNTLNNATMTFNSKNNTITCPNYDLFRSYLEEDSVYEEQFMALDNPNAQFVKEKSYYTAGKSMTWKLRNYSLKIVSYNDEIYVPYSIMQTFFLSKLGVNIGFNGDDYYYYTIISVYKNPQTRELNNYGKAFYGGSFGENLIRSKGYSEYFYGSFLFAFETSSGKLPTMGIKNLDKKLKKDGLKAKLLSSDSLKADTAIAETINSVFCDGGHTGFSGSGATAGADITRDGKLIYDIINTDTRFASTEAIKGQLNNIRGELKDNLKVSGETAIISFDGFVMNKTETGLPSYPTLDTVTSDKKSTFGILYNSFKSIAENKNIKNVIIDVSLNPGGAVPALGEALGFFTNDDVTFTTHDPLTGATNVEVVKYDTDLDGDFSDNDAPGANYNLYILTAPCSFSCANALSCIASDYGYAKIIGQKSGGGDCTVGYGSAIDGTSWQMSSITSIRHKDNTSVDTGAKVDYAIDDYSCFYDTDWLDEFVKNK